MAVSTQKTSTLSLAELSQHDKFILAKIKDPEASSTTSQIKIDSSLSPDPNLSGDEYESAKLAEIGAIRGFEQIDAHGFPMEPSLQKKAELVGNLDAIIEKYPKYASARNNRVQALRTMYGNGLLVTSSKDSEDGNIRKAADTILLDLKIGIKLLAGSSMDDAMSPRSAQTLANLYTQRGTLFNTTAKLLAKPGASLLVPITKSENEATEIYGISDFENQAFQSFQLGAWYGNELAAKLAPITNPMAKLCGEIVSNAMKQEIEGHRR